MNTAGNKEWQLMASEEPHDLPEQEIEIELPPLDESEEEEIERESAVAREAIDEMISAMVSEVAAAASRAED